MSVEDLQRLSWIFYILAGAMAVTAIVLFFVFQIPRLFREITGIAEKQGIRSISFEANETGALSARSGHHSSGKKRIMTTTGSLRKMMSASGRLNKPSDAEIVHTTKLPEVPEQAMGLDEPAQTERGQTAAGSSIPLIAPDTPFAVLEEIMFIPSEEVIG